MFKRKRIVFRARAIILNEGNLLLVKHSKDLDYYALPGGHLDFGEDIKECMSRELLEELGVKPEIGRLAYVHTFIQHKNVQSLEFFFEIKNGKDYLNTKKLACSHAFELSEIYWTKPTDNIKILPPGFAEDFKQEKFNFNEVRYLKDF